MTASDYDVTFPYGATSAPYSPAHPHRGDDRPCPTGTPIMVAGTQIGLTGATGNVIGAHLHIQEWITDTANTRKPQNAFKPGVVINVDTTGTQGDGSFGKFITIQMADGWNDSYCHLSRIDVKVGDKIGGTMPGVVPTDKQIDDTINRLGILYGGAFNLDAALKDQRPLFKNNYVEATLTVLDNYINDSNAAYKHTSPSEFTPVTEQLYRKTK